jgi:hypothetical protein
LRIDYDGYASARIAEQLTLLPAGAHRFTASARVEAGDPAARLAWTLTCASGGQVLMSLPGGPQTPARTSWSGLSRSFEVPADCPAQWLRLETRSADRQSPTVAWFDRVAISRGR